IKNKDYSIIEDRDNFDYLYERSDLSNLAGRRYAGKRNLYTNFINNYQFEFVKYEEIYKEQSLKLAKKWLDKKGDENGSLYNEYIAISELINNYGKLDVKGNVLIVEEKVVGFIFGEKLNDNSFVIHFEKGDGDFKGVYQTINKLFAEREIDKNIEFINREQDLGISGIRRAKESYYPVKMIKKYSLSF
ncbi:MAG TPA: phosphatidylglycerol lysyltransferase domain-containing protein, partial [Spirochaetota bacterium]|nr:phosphatidylglycerol lysyltransferase domain-containing protein [Spirochaetota bacterium]